MSKYGSATLKCEGKIGWIPFDKSLDNSNFKVCDELNIEEYYQVNPSYGEGMPSIRKYISSHQKELEELCEKDGYVISRFVINCQGQTDRYRTKFMSLNYTDENSVNAELQKKIIQLTRNMGNWSPVNTKVKRTIVISILNFFLKFPTS